MDSDFPLLAKVKESLCVLRKFKQIHHASEFREALLTLQQIAKAFKGFGTEVERTTSFMNLSYSLR